MMRVSLIHVLLLLLAACLAFAWYVERQAHVQLRAEIESLQQAAARVQLEEQAAKRKAAGEFNRLDSDLKEFSWLVGSWSLDSKAAFVPDWHLPGRPRLVFESYDWTFAISQVNPN